MKDVLSVIWERKWYLNAVLVLFMLLGIMLWLLDSQSFFYLLPIFFMSGVFLFLILVIGETWQNAREKNLVLELLSKEEASLWEEELKLLSPAKAQLLKPLLYEYYSMQKTVLLEQEKQRSYEEYIEAWAHEIKVPLSLFTLLLENRRQEMNPRLYQRLAYVNQQMLEYVQQMLYYARLKAVHKDYVYSNISLKELLEELLEEKQYYFLEQGIQFCLELSDKRVYTDERGLRFIVEQVLNNALKYRDEKKKEKFIWLSTKQMKEEEMLWLLIRDNGIGAKEEELPFLFDQGFTGDTGEDKKKATGMGLYLAQQMAKDIGATLVLTAKRGEWFQVAVGFPVVTV